jgi:succinate-acetate transporter protein
MTLGNPTPLGLLCFAMTTSFLSFAEMGWCETDADIILAGAAFCLGGLGQTLVAIIELIRGSSYSFAVFGSFGLHWLGWAIVYIEAHRTTSTLENNVYPIGKALDTGLWAILSTCFWVLSLRKSAALVFIFSVNTIAFWLRAVALGTGNKMLRKAGGYFALIAASGALYTGIAELINEELGRHVLPGLTPIYKPERSVILPESVEKRIHFDTRSCTLFLSFRGLQIRSSHHISVVKKAVERAILAAKQPDDKVHVVADYQGAHISSDIGSEFWEMISDLERKYFLSATHFAVSSFGTGTRNNASVTMNNARSVIDSETKKCQ